MARVSDTTEIKKVIDDQGRLKKQLRLLDTVPTLRANTHGNESKVVEPKILRVIDGRKELGYGSQDVYSIDGLCNTLNTMSGGGREPKILIKEATKKGYAEASVGDSVNYSIPTSKTRRGRVGKGVANTLDTGCQQGVVVRDMRIRKLTPLECWRLQGFPDELFYKAQAVNSNSQLYKQTGNSVTVNVVYEVAKHLGGNGD